MFTTIFLLFSSIRQGFRTRVALQAEIFALRHQLLVLQRSNHGHRLLLGRADRLVWVWLSRLWSSWRSALMIVKTETVNAWHRQGFRLYWRWKSRHPLGRPSVSHEVIDLIHKMSLANPRWGAPRIRSIASHGRQVHGAPAQAAFSNVEDISTKPCERPGCCGLLCGSNSFLRLVVCLRHPIA